MQPANVHSIDGSPKLFWPNVLPANILHANFAECLARMNSLVLHCASPAAHNIATSKVAVIFNMFNGHLKRGNKAPFCSRNAFNSDFDYSTRLKSVYLETRPSLFEENYHLKPKWLFCCCCFLCDEKGTVTLVCVLYSLWLPKSHILKRKILDSKSCIVLDTNAQVTQAHEWESLLR